MVSIVSYQHEQIRFKSGANARGAYAEAGTTTTSESRKARGEVADKNCKLGLRRRCCRPAEPVGGRVRNNRLCDVATLRSVTGIAHQKRQFAFPSSRIQLMLYFTFPSATNFVSWARDYRLEVTATDDGPVVTGTSGYICQHTDDLLAVTISVRWVSARHKMTSVGCVVVKDGDNEGTVSFDPHNTAASLAAMRIVHLR